MKKNCILIIEDENKLARTVSDYLKIQECDVLCAESGSEAIQMFCRYSKEVDLILLDVMLPDMDGFHVLQEIRNISDVPVIMVTARSSVADQMNGFEKGADDYITKPFTLELLRLHIEALLKRAGKLRKTLEFNEIRVDLAGHMVYVNENYVEMTRKEYELLVYFINHQDVVMTRTMILDAVWGYDYVGDVRTIDTVVKQLRKKLSDAGMYIRSIYGVGYIFGGSKKE